MDRIGGKLQEQKHRLDHGDDADADVLYQGGAADNAGRGQSNRKARGGRTPPPQRGGGKTPGGSAANGGGAAAEGAEDVPDGGSEFEYVEEKYMYDGEERIGREVKRKKRKKVPGIDDDTGPYAGGGRAGSKRRGSQAPQGTPNTRKRPGKGGRGGVAVRGGYADDYGDEQYQDDGRGRRQGQGQGRGASGGGAYAGSRTPGSRGGQGKRDQQNAGAGRNQQGAAPANRRGAAGAGYYDEQDQQDPYGDEYDAYPAGGRAGNKNQRRGRDGGSRDGGPGAGAAGARGGKQRANKKKKGGDEFDDVNEIDLNDDALYAGAYAGTKEQEESVLIEPVPEVFYLDDDDQRYRKLSYTAVKVWQSKMHPRDPETKEEFKWWSADLKYLPLCQQQIKKSEWVTPEAKAIGLGPVLYLHTMKAFAYLFTFFAIINIPVIMFYVKGQGEASLDRVTSGGFVDSFGRLTFGNLGMSDFTCSHFNVGRNDNEFLFSCPYGTMRELFEFGMQKIDNQSCSDRMGIFLGEGNSWDDLQVDCNFQHGLTPGGQQQLADRFQKDCYDKMECRLSIDLEWFTPECMKRIDYYAQGSKYTAYSQLQQWTFYQRDYRKREPVLFGVAFCIADKIYHPITGHEMSFSKYSFGYFLALVDVAMILCCIFLINLLEIRYEQYAEVFDKRNVEMRDFSVQIYNLPKDHKYGGKDIMLQAFLWEHIENHVKKAFEDKLIKSNNAEKLRELRLSEPWQIVDINFGKIDDKEMALLTQLDEKDRAKTVKIHEMNQLKKGKDPEGNLQKINALNEQITVLIKDYKVLKAEYIGIQEEKLYEKYEITEENGKSEADGSIQFAYVTFKSMQGKQKCVNSFSYCEAMAKENPEEEEKKFFEQYLEVVEAAPPGNIQWKNIQYGCCNRWTRCTIIWLLAIIIIAIAFYFMIVFKDWNDSLTESISLDTQCPIEEIDIADVYDDHLQPRKQRQGWLHCFCLRVYQAKGEVASTQEEFLKVNPNIKDEPCVEWLWVYQNSFRLQLITGALVGAINALVCIIFELTGPLEKCLSFTDEDRGIFQRIVVIQFLNVGALFLFSDFSVGDRGEDALPILMGKYRDFDTPWFYDVGAKITVAMISNSVAPHFAKLFEPLIHRILLRWCCDRCCKKHLRKKSNIDGAAGKEGGNGNARADERNEDEQNEGGERQQILIDQIQKQSGSKAGKQKRNSAEEAPTTPRPAPLQKQFSSDVLYEGGPDDANEEDQAPKAPQEEKDGEQAQEDQGEDQDKPTALDEEEEVDEDEPETGLLFQDELDRKYTGLPVQIWYMYAWFFTNLLVYMLYGPGFPIMYILAIVYFTASYWNYKRLFFTWHQTSFGFNEDVALRSVGLIKWALLFHLLMAMMMFSNKRVLTPEDYTTDMHYRPPAEPFKQFWRRRFDHSYAMTVAVVVLIILFGYLFWKTIIQTILSILRVRKEMRKKMADEEEEERGGDEEADEFRQQVQEDKSDDFYRELNIKSLRNHYVRANKEYEQFRTMINALSYDESVLSEEQAKFLKKQLKTRIQHIEDTIDIHLNVIGGLEQYIEQSYMYKFRVLEANEERIQKKYTRSQRMTDFAQSYNLYDAEAFHKEKQILERLDREVLELDFLANDLPVD